jgi:hypothetical protein
LNDKEASKGEIDLEEVDDTVIEAMLRFMYYFDYDTYDGRSSMIFNAEVYSIADRYTIPALKEHAKEKFQKATSVGWAMDDFPLTVAEVYSSTPETDRGLRDLVVQLCQEHLGHLRNNRQFQDVLKRTKDFAADLVRSFQGNPTYKCPNCHQTWQSSLSQGGTYYCIHCGNRRSDWNSYIESPTH